LAPKDFHRPPQPVAHLELPSPFAPKSRDFQRWVARSLADANLDRQGAAGQPDQPSRNDAAAHPVASCPDLRAHLRAAARADRLGRQVERLKKQVVGRTESLARQFDRVLNLLEEWGYVSGWSLTDRGSRLARIYHEQDLLVAECAERGLMDGLKPAEMAALVSVFTFEARGPLASEGAPPKFPGRRVEERWRAVQTVAQELNNAEQVAGLPGTRSPDAGFAVLAHGWATGKELAALLTPPPVRPDAQAAPGPGVSAGDFVRNVKQLIDLLRQLSEVLADEASADAARRGAALLFRGVVAASSVATAGSEGRV
jgi:ATP-dependent RNA helicase HelY